MLVLTLMIVLPLVVQIGSDHTTTELDRVKTFTESYVHHDQIWIQSNEEFDSQATAEGWDGDGSEEHPYVITGYLFDCESQPIRIWDTTVHWIVIDNVIDGVGSNIQCGTWIENATNGAIVNNEFVNRHAGMAITGYVELNITGNHVHDCWGSGIEVLGILNQSFIQDNVIENVGGAGIYSSMTRGSIVKDNTVSSCASIGISLASVVTDCIVTGNVVFDCAETGLIVSYGGNTVITGNTISFVEDQGIYMNTPDNCIISENTIGDVIGYGIRINGGDSGEINENIVENCTSEGLRIESTNTSVHWNSFSNVSGYAVNLLSDSNLVSLKYNTFIDNGGTCQVCDDGTANIISENYYNDWSSPDADADGYVDEPYQLDGAAGNQDDLPLANAGVIPTTAPDDSPLIIDPLIIILIGSVATIVIVGTVVFVRRK